MSIKTKELVNTWGGWLGEESWNYFSTITNMVERIVMFELKNKARVSDI